VRPSERPALATTNAGWLRHVSRALSLLIIAVLVVLLFRAGRDILAEGERMALDLAEQNLENLVWLEGKRVVAEEGVAGLQRRVGSDPRTWAQDRVGALRPDEQPGGLLPAWADDRWAFDATRGELVYRVTWLEGGDRRWRVELVVDGAGSPTPGLARDLLLVRAGDTK
jgi:hypothetical protein